ncbi:phosphoribosylformylglycinamidine synthase subunit PurL [Candidatus Omnitrophota bacterium]
MVKAEVYRSLGLKDEEYQRILQILGREPTPTELAMFSVEWSEHCGYPRSRNWLKLLPKRGKYQTLIGEDSGGIIVDDLAIIFKMESHNHPSQIEPKQGAATGVGGIIRDIFTAGARPIASLNSLRFGPLSEPYNRYLLRGVVDGIQFYGNCLDGGERLLIKNSGHIKNVEIGELSKQHIASKHRSVTAVPKKKIEVLSIDPKTFKPCWQPVKRIFKRRTDEIIQISTTMGRKIKITPDHPAVVYENSRFKIKKASELLRGERIPLLNTLPINNEIVPDHLDLIELLENQSENIRIRFKRGFEEKKGIFRKELLRLVPSARDRYEYLKNGIMPLKFYKILEKKLNLSRKDIELYKPSGKANYIPAIIKLDQELCRLFGYYLSEGCTSKNGNTYKIIWVFNKNEKEYIADVCNILRNIGIRFSVYNRKSTVAIYLSSWFLGTLFKDVLECGSFAHQKEIPEIFFKQPKNKRIELLKGIFRGDASVVFYKSGSRVKISFASTSAKLIHQVALLLQDLGILPSIYRYKKKKTKIEGRTIYAKPFEALEMINYKSIGKMQDWFAEQINLRIKESLSKYMGTTFSFPRYTDHGTFSTVKIKDITSIKRQQEVYDLEVTDTHLFVASTGIITHNCLGVPTVGGEIYFDESYSGNCLVNAMSIGVAKKNELAQAKAFGVGNSIMYVGSSTGRDGIGGCSVLASHEFKAGEEKRPTVQIGDPFTEKCLIEATLEALATGHVVGIKDMGAAGLTCSSSEMAAAGNSGVEIALDQVPRREENMEPWEVMMSESQERMLVCVQKGNEAEIERIFSKWDLHGVIIGEVIADEVVRVKDQGKVVAEIKAQALTEAPIYDMPHQKPDYLDKLNQLDLNSISLNQDYAQLLLKLLAAPTICNKAWVYEQYDHMVQTNTVNLPGSDATVLRLKETPKAIAATTDCNSRYCLLNPYRGAQIAVAEAARNLVCTGAEPAAVTDCLNFGNPEKPDRFWQFKNCVEGIADACKFFNVPVISGNVSFYNESPQGAINPTPTIGMIGIIEDRKHIATQNFKQKDQSIILLGENKEELGGSEYLKQIHGQVGGETPDLDLDREQAVQQTALAAIKKGLVVSAHDCSEGGLAVALAECCISDQENMIGAVIDGLGVSQRADALLFGESQSRIILSCDQDNCGKIKELAEQFQAPFQIIGQTTTEKFKILQGATELINLSLQELSDKWRTSLPSLITV